MDLCVVFDKYTLIYKNNDQKDLKISHMKLHTRKTNYKGVIFFTRRGMSICDGRSSFFSDPPPLCMLEKIWLPFVYEKKFWCPLCQTDKKQLAPTLLFTRTTCDGTSLINCFGADCWSNPTIMLVNGKSHTSVPDGISQTHFFSLITVSGTL